MIAGSMRIIHQAFLESCTCLEIAARWPLHGSNVVLSPNLSTDGMDGAFAPIESSGLGRQCTSTAVYLSMTSH